MLFKMLYEIQFKRFMGKFKTFDAFIDAMVELNQHDRNEHLDAQQVAAMESELKNAYKKGIYIFHKGYVYMTDIANNQNGVK